MTAIAVIMEEEQKAETANNQRHISRFLFKLANDPAFARAVISIMNNGGHGKIELTYSSGGKLQSVSVETKWMAGN